MSLTPLHYERPLSPGEVRRQPCEGGEQIRVGPREANEVLASMGMSLLILAALACLAFTGLVLCVVAGVVGVVRDKDPLGAIVVVFQPGLMACCLTACFGWPLWAAYRRRLGPATFTVTATDFGVNPTDDRFDPIWVARPRVTFVAVRRLVLRPVPGTVCLEIGLQGAPPLVALSGYSPALVERVADELMSLLWPAPTEGTEGAEDSPLGV